MSNDRFTLAAIDSLLENGAKFHFEDPVVQKGDGMVVVKDKGKIMLLMSEAAWEKLIMVRRENKE